MSIKSALRFVKVWVRRIGSLLLAGAIYSLILTGCVSTRGIFVAELELPGARNASAVEANQTAPHNVTVRFGYFGMCVKTDGDYSCFSTSKLRLENALQSNSTPVAQDIINLQHSISYLLPVISLICFLISLITLCMWNLSSRSRQKLSDTEKITKLSNRIRILQQATGGLLWSSTALALTAAYSTTSTLKALRMTASLLTGETPGGTLTTGTAVQVLQWAMFTLTGALSLYIHFWFRPSCETQLPTVNPFGSQAMSDTASLIQPPPTFAQPKQEDYNFFPPPPSHYGA